MSGPTAGPTTPPWPLGAAQFPRAGSPCEPPSFRFPFSVTGVMIGLPTRHLPLPDGETEVLRGVEANVPHLPEKQLGAAPSLRSRAWWTLTVLNDDFDEPDRASPCLGKEFLQLLRGYKNKEHGGVSRQSGQGGQGNVRGPPGLWGLVAKLRAGLNTAPPCDWEPEMAAEHKLPNLASRGGRRVACWLG